ncbi:hypothetical protein PMAYCL1PPCAC_10362, partial [Pristionchus mayeri]
VDAMADHLREGQDYTCHRSISQGAVGKVHSGFLCSTGESVVIKKGRKKDLKDEYYLLKQHSTVGVGRTHIVQVFGFTEAGLDFAIVMERAQCSLDQLLHRVPFREGLPAVDIIQLVADLGTVFGFLLDRKVVHRDIKPQNILVFSGANDPERSHFMFKLCDFGNSREYESADDQCRTIVGTRLFLHPEMALELSQHPTRHVMNKAYTPESCDLWSLGCTIFNAATGELPWPLVQREEDIQALHHQRDREAICALPLAIGGYRYYDTIRADSYPRWLRFALSSLIRCQFNHANYARFLDQAGYIGRVGGAKEMPEGMKGKQKRVVLLPTLTPSMHVEVDEKLFPGASVPLGSLFGLHLNRSTSCLTANGIAVFGAGQPISLSSIAADSVLVWHEDAAGRTTEFGRAFPRLEPESTEHRLLRCVQECYDLDRQCDEVIDAHRMAVQIAKKNVDRVIARTQELKQWLHSIDRNEKHAASTAAVASVMQSRNKEMLDRLQPCPVETEARRREVEACADLARQLSACAAAWKPLNDRPIANWQDSLHRLCARIADSSHSRTSFEMDVKWAGTMKKRVQDRLEELKAAASGRVTKEHGIAHVIRSVVALDVKLNECVRKMKETASLVSNIADQARERVTEYMQNTAGMDEAVIRRNLTNSVSAVSMLQRNVEKQAELAKKMEQMRLEFVARGGSSHSHHHGEVHANGRAMNGTYSNPAVKPTVINVNHTLNTLDMETIKPATTHF